MILCQCTTRTNPAVAVCPYCGRLIALPKAVDDADDLNAALKHMHAEAIRREQAERQQDQ